MTDAPQQPGLFDDPHEAEERARAEATAAAEAEQATRMAWDSSPQYCPICGCRESSGWMVRQNHGVGPEGWDGWPDGVHPNYGAQCLAQSLTEGHLRRTAGTDDPHVDAYKTRGRALGLDVERIIMDAQGILYEHDGSPIPTGHTVMRIENHYPRLHVVNVDMGDKPADTCADDFDHHRRHELGQSHDRDGDVFTIRHGAYPGIYQRIWWETAP